MTYVDRLAEKRRPALVVSSDGFNRSHGLLWVAMITSADNAPWASDILLPPAAPAGLAAPSRIRIADELDAGTAARVRKAVLQVAGQR